LRIEIVVTLYIIGLLRTSVDTIKQTTPIDQIVYNRGRDDKQKNLNRRDDGEIGVSLKLLSVIFHMFCYS